MSDAAQPTNDGAAIPPQDHDRSDVEILYKIYLDKRLVSQSEFYKSRVRENQSNANFTFLVSTAVMSISALVAAVSAVVSSPLFSLLSAILPALAALLAAFRQLYGWERQSTIYQDALMGLERVKLLTPDKDEMGAVDLSSIYPQLVTGGEEVFTAEVNQWGQFVQNADKASQAESPDTQVTNALMDNLRLTDDQIDTIRKIVAAGAPNPGFSEHTITVHPEETTALPAGGGVPTSATMQEATPSAPTPGSAPVSVTTTRTETATIHPQETSTMLPEDGSTAAAQAAPPDASAPISVTTTRVDTTVVEHVIPPADAPAAEAQVEPPQETMSSLAPGAAHVDAPQYPPSETDDLASHHELANEPPPPEALSSLTPGAMHVDAPQAPPNNPDADPVANPNDNG
jgi:SMODS and SLOG-associating 2TM effector domain 1